jgi:hypothetical protein
MEAPFTPDQRGIIEFVFNTLNHQIADLHSSLARTRRDLIALAGVLNSKGITISEAEWKDAASRIEAAHQVDLLFDPRVQRGEDVFARILRGEEIPEEEMNRWLRDIEEGD